MAQTAPIGEVGINYSHNDLDFLGLKGDAEAFQLEGSGQFGGDQLVGQVDGSVTRYDSDDLGGDATAFSATGHFKYNASPYSAGVFAGVQNNDEATLWGVGVEGKVTGEPGSLYLQFGYGQADDLSDVDFWAVRAEAHLFVNDNVFVGLNAGYTRADSGLGDLDMWNGGVDAEYQLPSTPFSVFAGYERGEMNDIDLTSDTFRVGARFTFGGTLRERDRAGVGQGSVTNLFGGSLGAGLVAFAGEILE